MKFFERINTFFMTEQLPVLLWFMSGFIFTILFYYYGFQQPEESLWFTFSFVFAMGVLTLVIPTYIYMWTTSLIVGLVLKVIDYPKSKLFIKGEER